MTGSSVPVIFRPGFMNNNETENIPFLRDPAKLAILYQVLTVVGLGLLGYYLIHNTLINLERQSISTGFGFLHREAGFEIGEKLVPYNAANSYGRALLIGFLNTLLVSFIGIVLTVLLGTVIGIARLSKNWLVSRLAAAYIELFQDIPILLQLFFWYAFFYEILPSPRQALHLMPGVFLCNRGLIFGVPEYHIGLLYAGIGLVIGIFLSVILRRWALKRQAATGLSFPLFRVAVAVICGLAFLGWLIGGAPTAMSVPKLSGFNFKGGMTVSPEFTALLLGLVLYTAAFVAEVVRAGIQSVSKGQREAAMSIGLKPGQLLHLVILPQALRVIVPPLTSQMLNLTKNSSLAVAIGYPDFVSVAGTTINQTGQAIEGVAMIMIVYLIFSLSTSVFMNWYNKKIALVER
jgi:general L-amino acid transport system permease protein